MDPNNTMNSSLSVWASSLIIDSLSTDANLLLSGGPQSWRSASTNMESYLSLPSSPMSFSSHNLSISGSSGIDDSSAMEQTSPLDKNCRQVWKRQQQQQQQLGVVNATSQPPSQTHYLSLLTGIKQEPDNSTQMPKKPRLEVQEEDFLHQQIIQQLLQRKDSLQLQGHNPHLQAWIQQHKMRNQQHQKILQSIQQLQGVDMQQQQQQMRNQLQQQGTHEVSAMRPSDSGICSRRLMQYMYHQRHRPPDNAISYWRKFVAEYYSPCAKKRWCLSLYDNVGHHAEGVFPQSAMDTWQCDICGSRSGRGFEAIFEVLPRLIKINFESGVIDELLFVDLPHESRFSSGLMMLEYGKAVQESVYEQLRVVREGQLRIIFTHDLKILSWEFCTRRHEELLPRQLVAPQVNQLVHAAQKYQTTMNGSKSDGFCAQDLLVNCNRFLRAGHQLARNLELQLVDELGFSKRYVRCLQIAEVVDSMKDLMIFVRDSNIGPIESLKNYPREATTVKIKKKQLHHGEQPESGQDSLSNRASNLRDISSGLMTGSEEGALALTTRYQKMMRQSSLNSNSSTVKREPCLFNSSIPGASSLPVQRPKSSSPGLIQIPPPVNSSSSVHSSQGSQNTQHCMIQKLLQEMMNNNRAKGLHNSNGGEEEVLCGINTSTIGGLPKKARGTSVVRNELGCRDSTAAVASPANVLGSFVGRDKSFKAASSSKSSGTSENNGLVKREPDLPVPEAVQDVAHGLYENDVFNADQESMEYGWKA
ncbi:probable transcriptional regulator SLK2 isoform X3 [Vitis riparia]|uniref:probable transcriptional regulator SLK2 isoform X3 n=1 Tax=Vitis riparia TaxID=96939 RepID=UPI00155A6012|nr:probable transcriptional regulator SLK2 isoform X3 [Vitis riparia]